MAQSGSLPLSEDGRQIIIVHIVFYVLTTVVVALRLWSRFLGHSRLHLEDYMVFAGLVVFYGYSACSIYGVVEGGIGYHLEEIATQPKRLQILLKTTLVNQFTYAIGLGLIKCSICVLLIRLFFVRPFRIAAWALMGLCISWAIMTILIGFLICRPLAFNWDRTITEGSCGNMSAGYAAVGVIDIVTDILLILLPQRMVWKLQLPRQTKFALGGVFALGLLTIIISIVRIVVITRTDYTDLPFSVKQTEIWTIAEFGVAIIVSCCPLLRPVLERIFPAALTTRMKYGTRTTNSAGQSSRNVQPRHGFSVLDDPPMPLTTFTNSGSESGGPTTHVRPGSGDEPLLDGKAGHGKGKEVGGGGYRGGYEGVPEQGIRVQTRIEVVPDPS